MAQPTKTSQKPEDDQRFRKPSEEIYDDQKPSDEQLRQMTGIGVGEEDQMDAAAKEGAKEDLAQREQEAAGRGSQTEEPKAADREELGAKEQEQAGGATQSGGKSLYKPEKGRRGRYAKKKGIRKLLGNRKKVALLSTVLLGGIGIIGSILLNLGSLVLPNLSFHTDSNRLKGITRNFMVSTDTVVKSKMALASTGDETYREILSSYRDPDSGLIAKLNKFRPGRVAQNLLIDAEFETQERRIPGTNINRERIVSVTYGGGSVTPFLYTPVDESVTVQVPQNNFNWADRARHPVSYMNSILEFRRGVRTLTNNFLMEMDPDASRMKRMFQRIMITGKASKAIRESADIKRWRWSKAEVDAADQENVSREDARVKETQRSYAQTTDDGARPREAASGNGAAEEELERQNACMAETECAREVTQGGDGLAPEVRQSLATRFSPATWQRIANAISGVSAFGYLLCLVNESSIGASEDTINSNSEMAMAGYASLGAAADQQVYTTQNSGDSRVNASLTGGLNDQVNASGGAARSNTLLRANGEPYDTSNTPSPQTSNAGMFGTDGVGFLPSSAKSVFNSFLGGAFCGIVGNAFGAIAIDGFATIISAVPGFGQAAKAGMVAGSKIVGRQVAKQFADSLRHLFTKRGASEAIAFSGAEQLTILVARAVATQQMGAAFNGAAQGEALLNQWDAGATVYSQDTDRLQNASRPLTTAEYSEVSSRDESFRTAAMQDQSLSERYFALKNPRSLANNLAVNLHTSFNLSSVSSFLQKSADIFNPTKLFAGLPFVAQESASAQEAYLDSPILSKEYGVTQWGWTDDEEAAYTNNSDYGLLHNEKVLEDSGQRDDLLDKYGKCFDPTVEDGSMGALLADGQIYRDQDANVVADRGGDCAPNKLGDSGPDNDGEVTFINEEAELVFRLRISLRNEQALDHLLEAQDPGFDADTIAGIGGGTLQPPSQQEGFRIPMRERDIVAISDYYNTCFSNDSSCSDGRHAGLDFSTGGATGDSILAMATGEVVRNSCAGAGGCHIIVEVNNPESYSASPDIGSDPDADGLYYNYQHMDGRSPFSVGETVDKGDVVGSVGVTGNTTGAHLHSGVTKRNTLGSRGNHSFVLNPACFLPREQLTDIPMSKQSPQTRQGVTASLFGGCD